MKYALCACVLLYLVMGVMFILASRYKSYTGFRYKYKRAKNKTTSKLKLKRPFFADCPFYVLFQPITNEKWVLFPNEHFTQIAIVWILVFIFQMYRLHTSYKYLVL